MRRFYVLIIALMLGLAAYAQTAEDRWVDSVYNSLTPEQRVGQLINVRVNQPNKPYFTYIQPLIEKYNIGLVQSQCYIFRHSYVF